MDPSLYRSLITRRGFRYSYYFSAPSKGKPVLVFAHSFLNTSHAWRYQVAFFKSRGYGLVVPDLLGVGKTDKPTDPFQYKMRLVVQDIIDILDFEKVVKAVMVGHAWGCNIVGRMANYYPDRFIGFAFLGVGYFPPSKMTEFVAEYEDSDLDDEDDGVHSDCVGCWSFFTDNEAPKLIEKKFDSFFSLVFADDLKLWTMNLALPGATQAWIEADKKAQTIRFVPKEEMNIQKELLNGNSEALLCFFKAAALGVDNQDAQSIEAENLQVRQPVFFGYGKNDQLSPAAAGRISSAQHCPVLTVKEFDTGHWLMWEAKDQVNRTLLEWLQGL